MTGAAGGARQPVDENWSSFVPETQDSREALLGFLRRNRGSRNGLEMPRCSKFSHAWQLADRAWGYVLAKLSSQQEGCLHKGGFLALSLATSPSSVTQAK